jgi:methionyl-tRNA formyltransferase
MKFCVAGKNDIAIYGLKLLLELGIDKSNIYCLGNKTDSGIHGWQPSFKKYCFDNEIAIVQQSDLFTIENLIFISLEYDQIIKTDNFVSDQLYNIHFSLLPAYKGMYTSLLPILNGESHSGVTLHKIDNGIDTGDIIDQIKFDLPFGTTGYELYKKYLHFSKILLKQNINNLISSKIKTTKQPILNSTYYSKKTIDFKNIQISFQKTCFEVCNFINAFSFRPYQLVSYKGYKIEKALPTELKSTEKPGTELSNSKYFIEVSTIDYNVKLLYDNIHEILDASSSNDLESIKFFHLLGYSLNEKNEKGWNPLIVGCYNGAIDVVKYLINNNICDINDTNNNGTSVLMYAMTYASKSSDMSIMQFLIEKGANIYHKDYFGKQIKEYAIEYGNNFVIDYLNNL